MITVDEMELLSILKTARLLDKPHSQETDIEVDILLNFTRNRRDMMDT